MPCAGSILQVHIEAHVDLEQAHLDEDARYQMHAMSAPSMTCRTLMHIKHNPCSVLGMQICKQAENEKSNVSRSSLARQRKESAAAQHAACCILAVLFLYCSNSYSYHTGQTAPATRSQGVTRIAGANVPVALSNTHAVRRK